MEDQGNSMGPMTHGRGEGALDISALVGSRICHDLISPLGAIANGLELLDMAGDGDGPEYALIAQSVAQASARLRFLRVAYGMAPPGQPMAAAEVRDILAALAAGGRLTHDWVPTGDVERAAVKLVFLLIQCLESAMPYGGNVSIEASGGRWIVTGSAARLRDMGELWLGLATPDGPALISGPLVHFALAAQWAARQGRRIEVSVGTGRVVLSA